MDTLKFTLSVVYSAFVGLLALFQYQVIPNPLWVALMFGAIMGMFARISLDVSRNGKRHLSKVFLESLATVFITTACGLLILEIAIMFFEVKQKIETGQLTAEFPAYLSACSACLFTLGGKDGLFFIRDTVKLLLSNWIAIKAKKDE